MSILHLAIVPRDGIFAKDGRGFYTSDVGRGHGFGWPLPTTIRGALRAALGRAIMHTSGRRLDPTQYEEQTRALKLNACIALHRATPFKGFGPEHRVWPVPADALFSQSESGVVLNRLLPEKPRGETLGDGDDPALEALWRPYPGKQGKGAQRPMFWSDAAMMNWLNEQPPPQGSEKGLAPKRRPSVRVTIEPSTFAATPSMLFSEDMIETTGEGGAEWAIGVACDLPESKAELKGPLTLGSKRRLAPTEPLAKEIFAPPSFSSSFGLRLVLATPTHFSRGIVPDGFKRTEEKGYVGRLPGIADDVVMRAALVPGPLDISGWDMAKNAPRKTRRCVPAGAVYFFVKENGARFSAADFRAIWLSRWGLDTDDGLGLVLSGIWTPCPEDHV